MNFFFLSVSLNLGHLHVIIPSIYCYFVKLPFYIYFPMPLLFSNYYHFYMVVHLFFLRGLLNFSITSFLLHDLLVSFELIAWLQLHFFFLPHRFPEISANSWIPIHYLWINAGSINHNLWPKSRGYMLLSIKFFFLNTAILIHSHISYRNYDSFHNTTANLK